MRHAVRRSRAVSVLLLAAAASSILPAEPEGGFLGMHCGNDTSVAEAVPVLKDLGVRWVRLWADLRWDEQKETKTFSMAREFKAAGFKVIRHYRRRGFVACRTWSLL